MGLLIKLQFGSAISCLELLTKKILDNTYNVHSVLALRFVEYVASDNPTYVRTHSTVRDDVVVIEISCSAGEK